MNWCEHEEKNKLAKYGKLLETETQEYRSGKFNNLTMTQQQYIIEVNRIILESLYPTICPRHAYFAFFGDTLVKGLRKEQSRDPRAKNTQLPNPHLPS